MMLDKRVVVNTNGVLVVIQISARDVNLFFFQLAANCSQLLINVKHITLITNKMKPLAIFGNTLFYLAFMALLFSCSNTKDDATEYIKIDIVNSTINASDIFSKVDVFKIEGIILGKIKKIIEHDNFIYIHTSSGEKRIHLFDKTTGDIVKSIGIIGKGPNEFHNVKNIFVFNNSLFAYDFMKKNIHQFTLNGERLSVIKLPDFAEDVNFTDTNTLVLYKTGRSSPDSKKEYKVNVYDFPTLALKKQFYPLQLVEEERSFSQLNIILRVGDKLLLTEPFSNVIYEIQTNGLDTFCSFDFDHFGLPTEQYENENLDLSEFIRYCRNSNSVWNINNVLSNGERVFFTFYHQEQLYSCLHSVNTKETLTYTSFNEDLLINAIIPTSGFKLEIKPAYISEEAIFFIIEPSFLASVLSNADVEYQKNGSKVHITESLSLDLLGNPLIFKYYFK